MSKDQKKPQAFPYCGVGDDLNFSQGMELRDYFAAKAMQALIQEKIHECKDVENMMNYGLADSLATDRNWCDVVGIVAIAAYVVAEEMLKARKK